MSSFIKDLINRKMNQITLEELLHYSTQYGFSLTQVEAQQILTYIQNNPIDPFDQNNREKIFQDLAQITDHNTASKAKSLFNEIINSYGLGHLFN